MGALRRASCGMMAPRPAPLTRTGTLNDVNRNSAAESKQRRSILAELEMKRDQSLRKSLESSSLLVFDPDSAAVTSEYLSLPLYTVSAASAAPSSAPPSAPPGSGLTCTQRRGGVKASCARCGGGGGRRASPQTQVACR